MQTQMPNFVDGKHLREIPLEHLARCEGYYICQKNTEGERLTPLVAYAARYDDPDNGPQYVGDVYANFAKAEQHVPILVHFAQLLKDQAYKAYPKLMSNATGFCAAPLGGNMLATHLASLDQKQCIYPEKKVIAVKTDTSREKSILVFDRHEPKEGEVWWIVEDVCNNFSTTAKLVHLIEEHGASVAGILCFLNRSVEVDVEFKMPEEDLILPVVALVRKSIPQYRQEDPFVKADIDAGNVVWKPKNEWDRLTVGARPVSV